MLMPLPATLRRLVREYETLSAEEKSASATAPSPRLRDLAYTLCVSTGTRDVAQALEVARSYLASAAPRPSITLPRSQSPAAGRLSGPAPVG